MISKLTLNNEIVAMRKVVKQGKVHVISKLVREIRKLRARHGPENVRAKCIRKADRKGEEITVIKKIKHDDVSKFALKSSENPMEALTSPDISVEQRALYRLAANKLIAEKVKEIHLRYPDLKDCIVECLEELGARRKKYICESEKLDRKDDVRKGRQLSGKRCEANNQPNSMGNSSMEVDNDSITSKVKGEVKEQKHVVSGWIVEDMDSDGEESAGKNAEKFVMEGQKLQKRIPTKNSIMKEVMYETKKFKSNTRSRLDESRSIDKIGRGMAEIRNTSEVEREPAKGKDSRTKNEGESNVNDKPHSPLKETVDPFFVNPDGKTKYLTSAVPQDHNEVDGIQTQERKKSFVWGKDLTEVFSSPIRDRKMKSRIPDGRDGLLNMKTQGYNVKSQSGRISAKESQGKESKDVKTSNIKVVDEKKLHPSWEAKRRQKELSISDIAFRGKKIKFENDD